jgi:Flp pilus assembly protein TadD
MGERDPLISAALGIIPGLGQVYTGKTLLGIVVFFITIIAFLAILWFGVLIWALSIFYAWHTAKRISTGEIQFSEPGNKEYLIFIAGIVVTCVICVVINLIFLVLLFSGSNTGFISSSGYRSNYNVSIVVGKNGTLITLYNSEIEPYENIIVGGGKEPYCSGGGISCPISKRYTTTINGIETKKCWVIGPLCEVYGTTGKDHIVVESDIGTYEGNSYHGSFETYVGCNATLEGEVACEATGLCIAGDKTCNESKIYTQYAKAQTMTGLALADSGNMAGALASLNRAIAIDPTQSAAWEVRGIVHARSGKITDSQADFEMAVTLLENSSPYWYNLGVSRSLLGNRSGAVDAYGHALLLDKNLTNSQLMIIGKAFIALGQYGAAIRIFENVNAKEFAIESMQERGIALAVLGRYNESSSAFDAAIDANPLNIRYCPD